MDDNTLALLVAVFGVLAAISVGLFVIRMLNKPVVAAIAFGVLGWLCFFYQLGQ